MGGSIFGYCNQRNLRRSCYAGRAAHKLCPECLAPLVGSPFGLTAPFAGVDPRRLRPDLSSERAAWRPLSLNFPDFGRNKPVKQLSFSLTEPQKPCVGISMLLALERQRLSFLAQREHVCWATQSFVTTRRKRAFAVHLLQI